MALDSLWRDMRPHTGLIWAAGVSDPFGVGTLGGAIVTADCAAVSDWVGAVG